MSVVELTIKDILVEYLGVDENKVTPESKLESDLGADSLDAIEILMAIEDGFDIDIPEEHVDRDYSLAQMTALVEELVG